MARHVVMNLKKVPIKVSGLKMVEPPDLSFKIEVAFDRKVEKEAAKDPLLLQEFQSQADDILTQTKRTIEQKCKVFDRLFVDMINKGADKKQVEKQLKGLNDAIRADMAVAEKAAEIGVQAAWKDLQSKRQEYRKFKITVAKSITATLAGLTVSIAGLAASGFTGGASGALAIVGLIKAGVTLAQDIKKLAIGIEGARKELEVHLKFVEAAADKRGMFTTNEIGAAVLKEFIGVSQPSIKSIQDCTTTLKAKYAQMVVKVHDLSKTLNKLLITQEKVGKEFMADVAKKLQKHPVQDKKAQIKAVENQLDALLGPNYDKVAAQIDRVQSMYQDTKEWAPKIKDLVARAAKLNLKDSKGLKVLREVLKAGGVATGAINGNAIASTAGDLAQGLVPLAGLYAYDKITSLALDGTVFDAA